MREDWFTIVMGIVYTLLVGALLLYFSEPVMRLFDPNPKVIAYGQSAIKYFCPFYWLLAILHGLAGTVRGTGKSIPPMMILLISLCAFRIAWLWFVLPYIPEIDGIFVLYPVSWLLGKEQTMFSGSLNGPSPCSIAAGGSVVKAFSDYGWGWGGQGYSVRKDNTQKFDYMHFSIMASGG